MELQRTFSPGLNLTVEQPVLSYLYNCTPPLEVIARIDLGDSQKPIAGGGDYVVTFWINNILVTPITIDNVPAGKNQTIVVSRQVPISMGDTVVLKVKGLPLDASVDVVASLRTATPLQKSDVFGPGQTAVDHNFEVPLNLAYYKTINGPGIAGATILVYRASDYHSGNTGQEFVIARTHTVSGGLWANPVFLDVGDYTVVYYLANQYGVDTRDITIEGPAGVC